ncbi:hypothetical protein [Agrobacterium salinitolerans]|uniref:hypothetical protein n=1 Tax=Agrobacterium salinitolerans TaxID=1183413 RepID=UPI0022B853CA|nr:hypothetical protein [Agrobacterium salinitolerans]MCZ7854828.1 hypothetical protein [Agrobacterium salinitolerans]MCZ7977136.1 hypothetical protein [Agrobacterium salinitolerans]
MKVDLIASKDYEPAAIYNEDSDSLEYLRLSMPSLYRRVDSRLTLVLSLEDRSIIGFKLKGFKNLYLRKLKSTLGARCPEFIELVDIIQEMTNTAGAALFEEQQKIAYSSALEMAAKDNVHVRDLPKVVG